MTIKLAGLDGGAVDITPDMLQSFKAAFRGPVLTSGDPEYEASRKVWNAMIDRRPGLIARCTGTVDVVHAVRFASEHGILVSVRGGGHNISDLAVCEGGLMIDMSHLRGVWVDPVQRTAHAQAGCTLGDVDRETQLHGLAAVLGFVSETGIAGLTLGGGFGYLTRRHGWACDNVISMEVVTAAAEVVRVSKHENPECFGRCAAAAVILASSRRSNINCTQWARKFSAASSPGAPTMPSRCWMPIANSVHRRHVNSPQLRSCKLRHRPRGCREKSTASPLWLF